MTDPSEEELERAERIKQLRDGVGSPRRERRRPDLPEAGDADPAAAEDAADVDHEGPLQPDDLDLPADAPGELTVASLYLTEDLRTRMERLEEHLHLRYSFQYDGDLDGPRHLRPLALSLGLRQLDKLDLGEIRTLFEQVEEVERP
jgi:hypothetical protein